MAIAFSSKTTQDIISNLEAAYADAKLNGLEEVSAQHYATGGMHDLLSVITRRWQDVKDTEAATFVLHPPVPVAQLLPYVADLLAKGYSISVYRGRREWLDARIVEPTGSYQVGYLTVGSACNSYGSPSVRSHGAVPAKGYDEYLLTADDWQRICEQYEDHRANGAGSFQLSDTPWCQEVAAA